MTLTDVVLSRAIPELGDEDLQQLPPFPSALDAVPVREPERHDQQSSIPEERGSASQNRAGARGKRAKDASAEARATWERVSLSPLRARTHQ